MADEKLKIALTYRSSYKCSIKRDSVAVFPVPVPPTSMGACPNESKRLIL